MPTKKTTTKKATTTTKDNKPKGCRRCKYRVAPPNQKGERHPACCFGYTVNDKEVPKECGELFTETDYYVKHPDEL